MKNPLAVLALMVAAGLAAVCALQSRQKAVLEIQVADLQRQLHDSGERQISYQARTEKLDRERRALRMESESLNEQSRRRHFNMGSLAGMGILNTLRLASNNAGGSISTPTFRATVSQAMNDPAVKNLMRKQQEGVVNLTYGPLLRQVGLTPEEDEKVRSILLTHQLEAAQNAAAFLTNGAATNSGSSFAKTSLDSDSAFNDRLKSVLGEARFEQFQAYNEALGQRVVLNQFLQQQAGGVNPLSDEQSQQLLQIMSEETRDVSAWPTSGTGGAETVDGSGQGGVSLTEMDDYFSLLTAANQRILQRASAFLGSEQIQALSDYQSGQVNIQRLGATLAFQVSNGQTPASGNPQAGATSPLSRP